MFDQSAALIAEIATRHTATELASKNEAATRLHVIDRILFEGLGWDRSACLSEQPAGGTPSGFLDYALVDGAREYICVEAKRSGTTFDIPKESDRREYLVQTLLQHCGDRLAEVVEQAHKYAVSLGIPFAVATNGAQWIIFRPHTLHGDWRKGRAIVFRGFEDLSANWSRFHGLLSRERVTSGHLDVALLASDARPARFARSYNRARGADSGRGHNELAKAFNMLFRQVFDSIVTDRKMLQNCYVSNDSGRSYQQQFASLLSRPTPHFIPSESDVAFENGTTNRELVAAVNGPCVVVLVGNAGAGKTTFVHHFLEVYLPSRNSAPIYHFIRDLKDEAAAVGNTFDATRAERDFYESLLAGVEGAFKEVNPYSYEVQRQIFSHELFRLKTGAQKRVLEGDHDAYLRAEAELLRSLQDDPQKLCVGLLRHIGGKGRPLCVAFDNVDQGSDTYQQFVYTLAHRLAREAHCMILVTLRHSVYEAARERGFLDIRNDLVFLVSPPSLKEVVSKRIKHARALLTQPRRGNADHDIAALSEYLEVINELLLGEVDDIRRMLEALAAGNIRSAFSYLQRFATSGHTDVGHLITIYNDARKNRHRPRFAVRDFFRPFVLGEYFRFHSKQSPVVNLFDVSPTRQESHFTGCRVLSFLLDKYNSEEGGKKGEVAVSEILAALAGLGHSEATGLQTCQHLAANDLIERLTSHIRPLTRDDVVRISAAGSYYMTDMVFSDDYIFFLSQDTYIYEAEAFRLIELAHKNIEGKRANRLSAVSEFLRYLRRQESIERTATGVPSHERVPWDRAFATEMGAVILGGIEWAPPSSPPEQTTSASKERIPVRVRDSSPQLGFGGMADNSFDADISTAATAIRPLAQETSALGSKQLARVVWALGVAQAANLPPINASEIARIVSEYGNVPVEATNIARFFRTHGLKYGTYFIDTGTQRYSLSPAGAKLLSSGP